MSYIEKIRRQLFAKTLVLVAIPVIIIMAIAMGSFTYMYERYSNRYLQMTVENTLAVNTGVFERTKDDLDRQVGYLLADSNVGEFFLNEDMFDERQAYHACVKSFNAIAVTQINSNDYMKAVALYSEDMEYIMSTGESEYLERMEKPPVWLEKYLDERNVSRFAAYRDGDENRLFYIYPARLYGEIMGAVVTELYYDKYMELYDTKLLDDFYIVNERAEVIATNHYEEAGMTRSFDSDDELYESKIMSTGLYSIHMTYSKDKVLDFTILSIGFYVVLVLMLLIMLTLVVFIAIRTYAPIRRILDLMDEQSIDYEGHKDSNYEKEYELVIESVRNTMEDNKMVHAQLAEKLTMLNKMHTVALQSQINPHFLSNTLQAISLCAEYELSDGNTVSKMILLLSELIAVTQSTKSHLTVLSEEIRHVILFYKLQKIMLGEKIKLEMNVSPEFYNCMIPKITLQPVLENAFFHGIKPAKKNCEVIISAEKENNILVISVKDDGVGMTEDELARVTARLESNEFTEDCNIGLSNINQRIKLIYGDEYGLKVYSEPEKGTEVKIYIPVK